jgi:DNA polymerase-3 subunit gamma/tau
MYQVIARKYRPQTFSELISQEHVKTTLENAISQKRIAHGYIFLGPARHRAKPPSRASWRAV